MKKFLILISLGIILLNMIMINGAMGFIQKPSNDGNGTVDDYIYSYYTNAENVGQLSWNQHIESTLFGLIHNKLDQVPIGKPFEIPLVYKSNIAQWNNEHPNNQVDWCKLVILKLNYADINTDSLVYGTFNDSIFGQHIVFVKNYTAIEEANNQYFFKLYNNDYFFADVVCKFDDVNYKGLDIPFTMYVYTPTWQCKACQFSQWSTQTSNIIQANIINSHISQVSNYMTRFISLNFEILLYLFWLFIIAILFFAIGMIFWGMYYVYFYFASVIK